ncbi:hypothetical protein AVEN_18440-1 [Araneus ventricosus]|uniref:Uncharacterized protein n=1 Tax=Araneus ventricosus TaxID=182803 RepID=A0A4Y2PDZ5_ARAVE|nr:hypothetical protein AVEN_18440-1 [Araneus ventricosus]
MLSQGPKEELLGLLPLSGQTHGEDIVRSPKIPQIISGNFFSHAMDHRTEQVPQRGVLIKTPPKGAGFESGALGLLFSGRDEKGQLSRA